MLVKIMAAAFGVALMGALFVATASADPPLAGNSDNFKNPSGNSVTMHDFPGAK